MTAENETRAIGELRKSGQLEAALQRGREALRQWPDDRALRRAIGWCLWEKTKAFTAQAFNEQAWNDVLRYLTAASKWANAAASSGGYDKFDPLPLMVTSVMRAMKQQQMPARVLEAATFANPALLPTARTGDFSSHRMAWMSLASWAWTELEDWTAILRLEKQGTAIPNEDDGKWVRYRFALAHENTADAEGALQWFDTAFPTVSAAWQRVARARMLLALGRKDEAVEEARRALAVTGDDDLLMTIDAFHVLAHALATIDRPRAVAHAAIALAVRQQRGFGPDAKVRSTCELLGISDIPAAEPSAIAEQRAWWKAANDAARVSGEVSKHLAHGGSGFITATDGKEYYFSKKRDDPKPLMPVGTKVTFEPVVAFDAKRNAPGLKAVKVRRA